MSWKQTQIYTAADEIHTAAEEGVGAAMIFTHEWDAAHQPVAGEGPSRQASEGPSDTQLHRGEFIDLCFIYIFNFVTLYM